MLICHANNELIHPSIVHISLKELLDDSLVRKLSKFTSKKRLTTQVRRNCATQEVLHFVRGGFASKKWVAHMECYCPHGSFFDYCTPSPSPLPRNPALCTRYGWPHFNGFQWQERIWYTVWTCYVFCKQNKAQKWSCCCSIVLLFHAFHLWEKLVL